MDADKDVMSIEAQQICIHLTRVFKKQFTPSVYLIAEISQPYRNLQKVHIGTSTSSRCDT